MKGARIAAFLLAAGFVLSLPLARADVPRASGVASRPDLEREVSAERLLAVASGGASSTLWETLEGGERLECLGCVPAVARLVFDPQPATREIAAWWLRRRIFGVFGPGEVYEQTLRTLREDPDPQRRAYAAQAIGEFLARPGVAACRQALQGDPDAGVRAAAAAALGRLGDDGGGSLSQALGDGDEGVRLAALDAGLRIHVALDGARVTGLLGDGSLTVRRRAVEALESLGAKDAVASLLHLAAEDPVASVRGAACHALGRLGDTGARPVLEARAQGDADGLVRDQARIALRRLGGG